MKARWILLPAIMAILMAMPVAFCQPSIYNAIEAGPGTGIIKINYVIDGEVKASFHMEGTWTDLCKVVATLDPEFAQRLLHVDGPDGIIVHDKVWKWDGEAWVKIADIKIDVGTGNVIKGAQSFDPETGFTPAYYATINIYVPDKTLTEGIWVEASPISVDKWVSVPGVTIDQELDAENCFKEILNAIFE